MSVIIPKNITPDQVDKAKGMLHLKMSLREIARSLNISPYTVFRIKGRHYDAPHCFNKTNRKFIPPELKKEIKESAKKFSYGVVSRKFRVSKTTVWRIVHGKRCSEGWKPSKYKCPITGMSV